METIFVGAGAVADKYARGLGGSPLSLSAVCDLRPDRAADLAAVGDATAYADLDAALAAESAPLVVNLTGHDAHASVTRRALSADRHVFTEKPLALDAGTARDLVSLAQQRELAIGAAPINHRCETQRHARTLLADGRFGPVRLGFAHAHVGRVTDWHDDPGSFLAVGPLYDGAVYPLSLLVDWFGPVAAVRAADAVDVWPDRATESPDAPAHVEATLAFARGPVVRLTASFYAPHRAREFYGLELHGDDGSLYLDDAGAMAADAGTVSVGGLGREYVAAPLPRPSRPCRHLDGPERLAAAVEAGRRPTKSARRSAHVVAVCNAIETAATGSGPESVATDDVEDGSLIETAGVEAGESGGPSADDSSARPTTATGATLTRPPSPVRPRTRVPADAPGPATRDVAIRLPPVGFGCSRYRDGEYRDRIDAIATALDAGYRLLDSAELYGNEARIGDLLASPGSPDREALFLVGKVWNTNHGHVREAVTGSLDELGVGSLDAALLHWPEAWAYQGPLRELAERPPAEQEALTFPENEDGTRATAEVSLVEAWRRLEAVRQDGMARTIGLSNVSLEQFREVLDAARVPPAVVQVERHPYRPRTGLLEAAHEAGVRVLAHSPLSAPGLLAEDALATVATGLGVSPAQVVVAWNVEAGVVPIPSSDDPDHVVDNLAAAGLRLDPEDRELIAGLADPSFER
ncbi:MAG: aldo/keto reductase [Halobacteriales archaeon]